MEINLEHLKNRTLAKLTYYSPLYFYRKAKHEKIFFLGEKFYEYHFNEKTWRSERAVEIGLAKSIVMDTLASNGEADILEVGNVMHFYLPFKNHDIIDKEDSRNNTIKTDLFDYKPDKKYNLIVCISTLEHVGWDENPRKHNKFLPAIEKLKSLLKKGGLLFFTIPIGYNKDIDTLIKRGSLGFEHYFLKRKNSVGDWEQVNKQQVEDKLYGQPFLFANAIMIGFVRV